MGRLSRDYAEFQLARDPANVPARINLATYLLGTGRREQARAALQKALEYQPENEQGHYLMGVLYRTQNRLAEARTEFEQAIKANPKNGKAHGNLGIVLAGLGEWEPAVQHLEAALRIDPEDTVAKNSLDEIRRANPKN
jgi:Tfp pilus assembly protein PilF